MYGNNLFLWGGRADAQRKEEFQVVPQSSDVPEVVVLRVYGDYLLTVPFDRSTKEVEKKLFKGIRNGQDAFNKGEGWPITGETVKLTAVPYAHQLMPLAAPRLHDFPRPLPLAHPPACSLTLEN